MKWYEIGIPAQSIEAGHHSKLIEMMRRIWEKNGKPEGFALLGEHKVETPYGRFTVYYLTPSAGKYCSPQVLTIWQVVPTDSKPSLDSLKVLAGDKEAIHLLD